MLTVLQVAYPLAPVSLDATGGAEQIMALLDRGLVSRGHQSIAIACAGSRTVGHLLPVEIAAPFDADSQQRARTAFQEAIQAALRHEAIDLVHMHGVDFYHYLPPPDVPVLVTLHLPVSYYPEPVFCLTRPDTWLNCVSETQRRTVLSCHNLVRTIDNGVPPELFAEQLPRKENYALALGRICPEKGLPLALDAAEQAGVPLWIAGAVFPYADHERHFREELQPRLVPPHRFLGPVGFAAKIRLLSAARCLLVPSLAPETSSLVAMEALACGTPVIVFRGGAPAAYIEHGVTGFVVDHVSEMAAAIRQSVTIDGAECRRRARLLFPAERMIDRYISLYERLLKRTAVPAAGA